jgi:hypothetical protein
MQSDSAQFFHDSAFVGRLGEMVNVAVLGIDPQTVRVDQQDV